MKKTALSALLSVMALCSFAQSESIKWQFNTAKFAPWYTSAVSGKFDVAVKDAEGANDGKALSITCSEAGTKGTAAIWGRVYQKIKTIPGMNYELKVRYKTLPGFNGNFELWVRPGVRVDDVTAAASDKWQEAVMDFYASKADTTLYLTVTKGTGTVLVDEVTLTPHILGNRNFGKKRLAPWYTSAVSGKFNFAVKDNSDASNGKVLDITCSGDGGKGANKIWGRAHQTIKVVKGKKYHFTVYFKIMPGTKGSFETWVRAGKGKNANRTITAPAKEGWQELSGFFVPAEDKAVIYLTITKGTGTVLVDEVVLKEM